MLLKGRTWQNYTDKTYLSVLLTCACSYWLIGCLLLPMLSYVVLDFKTHDSNFINSATLVNIVPSLPFLFSFVIAALINNSKIAKIRLLSIGLICVSSIVVFFLQQKNITVLSIYVLLMSLAFRALYFALDKQITVLLHNNVTQFQSDLLILSTLGGIIFPKLGNAIYQNYGVIGDIALFATFSILLMLFTKLIPEVANVDTANKVDKISFSELIKLKALVKLISILCLVTIAQSPFFLVFFIKLHELNITTNSYANILAYSSVFSLLAAFINKNSFLANTDKMPLIIGICLLCEAMLFAILGSTNQSNVLYIIYFLTILLSGIVNIQNFAWIIKTIKVDAKLVNYTSFINGVIASLFYLCYLFTEFLVNYLLNTGVLLSTVIYTLSIYGITVSFMLLFMRSKNEL